MANPKAMQSPAKAVQDLSTTYGNLQAMMPRSQVRKPAVPARTPLGNVTVRPGQSTRYERSHPGVDIANAIGTIIPAMTGGAVTAVKNGATQGSPGFGNYVIITDKEGNKHRYSHLNNSMVRVGENVEPGQPIAKMGNSGQAYSQSGEGDGAHLDYRIQDLYGKYVNPEFYIQKLIEKNL